MSERLRRAIVLCAGRGERMRPLTLATPKPLLTVGGVPLVVHHLRRLAEAGIEDIAVNVSWLKDAFPRVLGDGSRYGVRIRYFDEGPEPLDVGGGIHNALDFFAGAPFAVVNGDVYSDYPLPVRVPDEGVLGHLVLVPNPAQHPCGDFALECGEVRLDGPRRHTYAGLATLRPALLAGLRPGAHALKPLLVRALSAGRLTGEVYPGLWNDVGTPERLAALNARNGP